jgi:hypothetical protein
MSTSEVQLGKCQQCGGEIDDRRELGIIEWRHCRVCGSWSADRLPGPPAPLDIFLGKLKRCVSVPGQSRQV